MDQVYEYLGYAFYYGTIAGLVICFVILLGYMLWYKQWLNFFLSLFFLLACGSGFLIPLVIGWQEAKNWKIPKLIRLYSVLVLFGFFILSNHLYVDLTTQKEPEVKGKKGAKAKGAPGKVPKVGIPKPR
jgi:hypothetical protein